MNFQKISWDDVPEEQVNDKMIRKMIYGDKIMIARMKFKDGFIVPMHSHENEQITQVQKGTIRFGLNLKIHNRLIYMLVIL